MGRILPLALAVLLLASTPATAATTALTPPLDAAVSDGFEASDGPYGSGHRGIDYYVERGTRIRAAAAGVVSFAGRVPGGLAITIDHGSGVETTYSLLSEIDLAEGDRVDAGRWIGTSGLAHGHAGLHFGVKIAGSYVDPSSVFVELDVSSAIHLAPLRWTPSELGALGDSLADPATVRSSVEECEALTALSDPSRPPNENVAIAVAGITSKTKGGVSADIYEHGPETLGYPAPRVYEFSYAGTDGARLHRPYARNDTYIDIRTAAARLGDLVDRVARRHPGRSIDLLAHSQGGIVARTYLSSVAGRGRRSPQVEHLVTFATPHRGAPGASQVEPLRNDTRTGPFLLGAMKDLSAAGWPVPDPTSAAVRQLAPGSKLMTTLADHDVAFGTRVLALTIPNDPVVTADHALLPGEIGRAVPPNGSLLGGHSGIVVSPYARGLAYSFLAERTPSCITKWDLIAHQEGKLFSSLERGLAGLVRGAERGVWGGMRAGPGAAAAEFVYGSITGR